MCEGKPQLNYCDLSSPAVCLCCLSHQFILDPSQQYPPETPKCAETVESLQNTLFSLVYCYLSKFKNFKFVLWPFDHKTNENFKIKKIALPYLKL